MDRKDEATTLPVAGFYYHYKHWGNKNEVNSFAYEVLGIGQPTETEYGQGRMVVYRPLYETAPVFKDLRGFDLRPVDMFTSKVIVDNVEKPRFERITDQGLIRALTKIRDAMYNKSV